MKIIVTGGAGFIGSAVVRQAIAQGHEVVNLDALTYAACLDNVAQVADDPLYHFEQVNITDRPELDRVFAQHAPDAVLHLAAESHVDRSIDGPADFVETNITGTFNLLEASRKYWMSSGKNGTKNMEFRFHHVSTDEVFGSLPQDPSVLFHEDTAYDPRSPYSASKASSDHLVRAWHETYGLPVIITNCSNNYGPYQFPEKLVPVVLLKAFAQDTIPIYGDGSHVRDWLYVEDHAQALLLALQKGQNGRSYNIGGENAYSNLELVHMICRVLDRLHPRAQGLYEELIEFVEDRPGHDARYAIDPTRVQTELGWRAEHSLEQGLEKTILWYLSHEAWWQALMARTDGGAASGVRLGTRLGISAS